METHLLFTHNKFMQPCSTGLAEKEYKIHQELRQQWKQSFRNMMAYEYTIRRRWRNHIFTKPSTACNKDGTPYQLKYMLKTQTLNLIINRARNFGDTQFKSTMDNYRVDPEMVKFEKSIEKYIVLCKTYHKIIDKAKSIGCLLE